MDRTLVLTTSAVVTFADIVLGQSIAGTEPFWGYIDEIRDLEGQRRSDFSDTVITLEAP